METQNSNLTDRIAFECRHMIHTHSRTHTHTHATNDDPAQFVLSLFLFTHSSSPSAYHTICYFLFW